MLALKALLVLLLGQWETVAVELNSGRTAAACLARYQRCHNPDLISSKWTPEEATRLAAAVAKHGARSWQVQAHVFETIR